MSLALLALLACRAPQPADPDRVVQVATGRAHACALWEDGAVDCWGENGSGQLGTGEWDDRNVPTRVVGLRAVEIDAGGDQTCARDEAGAVHCWGEDDAGGDRAAPALVLDGACDLAVGHRTACAVGCDGVVRCWGSTWADLGIADQRVPTPVGVDDAVAVSVDGPVSCAIRRDRSVACWFRCVVGGPDCRTAGAPVPLEAITAASEVDVGPTGLVCVSERDGAIRCFDGDPTGRVTFAAPPIAGLSARATVFAVGEALVYADGEALRVKARGGSERVVSLGPASQLDLFPGARGGCAVVAGGVRCWGGAPAAGGPTLDHVEPVRVDPDLEHPGRPAPAGYDCALREGRVRCTGSVPGGREGPPWTDMVTFTTGEEIACGLRADGRVHCLSQDAPIVGVEGALQVVVGDRHACARTADRVLCWGAADVGQLGDGTRRGRAEAAPVTALGAVDELWAGRLHTCARTGDETWCWGSTRLFAFARQHATPEVRQVIGP